jgi:hypothetical protein
MFNRTGTASGEYNRRTREKAKAGVAGNDTICDRGVAGNRPRRFRVCAPVRGTDAVPAYAIISGVGYIVIMSFGLDRTLRQLSQKIQRFVKIPSIFFRNCI